MMTKEVNDFFVDVNDLIINNNENVFLQIKNKGRTNNTKEKEKRQET